MKYNQKSILLTMMYNRINKIEPQKSYSQLNKNILKVLNFWPPLYRNEWK